MMKLSNRIGILAASLMALPLASPPVHAQVETIGFSIESPQSSREFSVTVLDETAQAPIIDANVTVSELSGELKTVTVSKAGYSAVTIAGVPSSRLTIYLKTLETATPRILASGQVTGWRGFKTIESKPAKVGLVFRGLSAADLLQFNISSVVSPLMDTIDVFGERPIPSNVVMPEQSIPFLLGSIKVNKPNYRFPLKSGRESRLTAVEGIISSNDLIDIGQSGSVTPSALNKFSFAKIGLSEAMVPQSDFSLNLNADLSLSPAHSVTVNQPPFAADVMVAAVTDLGGDRKTLIPTDIKAPILVNSQTVNSSLQAFGATSLKSTAQPIGGERDVVAMALSPDQRRLSGIFIPHAGSTVSAGEFLSISTVPNTSVLPPSIHVQAPKQGLGALVFQGKMQQRGLVSYYPLWTVYALPSAGDVSVSTASLPVEAPVKAYSVRKLEFDSSFDERSIDGASILMKLQRFARSSAKIGT